LAILSSQQIAILDEQVET